MLDWKNQAIEILNEPGFTVTDPGPLHGPIHSFTVRRDERFALFIDTEAAKGATSTAREIPPGIVRINTDKVDLAHRFGAKATLSALNTIRLHPDADPVRETARIHEFTVTLPDRGAAVHTIEWLENLPSHHMWPDTVKSDTEKKTSTSFGDDGITGAAILEIAGHKLCVCGPEPLNETSTPRSGCIAYEGVPDELTRKKFRTALSLALGVYLVETAHTLFNKDWEAVTPSARTGLQSGRTSVRSAHAAVDLADGPQFPIRYQSRQADAYGRALLSCIRGSRSRQFKLGLLACPYRSAAYRTCAVRIGSRRPAEELREEGSRQNPKTILPDANWDPLLVSISAAIDTALIPDDAKAAIKENVKNGANAVAKREQLKALGDSIKITIGADEHAAWKRRNKAAHGVPIADGQELETIRDMKLLMVLFHRMLLAITGAADFYLDYASPGVPIRPLKEPVPSVATAAPK